MKVRLRLPRFKLARKVTEKFYKSIRLQIIWIFIVCLVASFFVGILSAEYLREVNSNTFIDYSGGYYEFRFGANMIAEQLRKKGYLYYNKDYYEQDYDQKGDYATTVDPKQDDELVALQRYLDGEALSLGLKILIVDMEGKVNYKSKNAVENEVDLYQLFAEESLVSNQWFGGFDHYYDNTYDERVEVTTILPVEVLDKKYFLLVRAIPQGSIGSVYRDSPLPLFIAVAFFFILFYLLTQKKMRYIEKLANGLLVISKGELDYRVPEKGKDQLGTLGRNINQMAYELQVKIEEERRAEKTKNELITNVSHDLRTPLTLIMGYLRVLKDKKYENDAQQDAYLTIAYEKSERLKTLLEDLFEYTKLSSEGVKLQKKTVCLNELLEQLLEEYVPLCDENELKLERDLSQEKVFLELDPDLIVRAFENLLNNAIKYSFRQGVVRVEMRHAHDHILIRFVNRGNPIPAEDLEKLFDRFYRIDSSRSSKTGGSGLGLAITKSIIELHDGRIWAENVADDQIHFVIEL